MRSLGSIISPLVILSGGVAAAFYFRKGVDAPPTSPAWSEPAPVRFRVTKAQPAAGPLPAAPLLPSTPRFLGTIIEDVPAARPLGLTLDAPPRLPPLFPGEGTRLLTDGQPWDGTLDAFEP